MFKAGPDLIPVDSIDKRRKKLNIKLFSQNDREENILVEIFYILIKKWKIGQ